VWYNGFSQEDIDLGALSDGEQKRIEEVLKINGRPSQRLAYYHVQGYVQWQAREDLDQDGKIDSLVSHFDIFLPDTKIDLDRPTWFAIHGGFCNALTAWGSRLDWETGHIIPGTSGSLATYLVSLYGHQFFAPSWIGTRPDKDGGPEASKKLIMRSSQPRNVLAGFYAFMAIFGGQQKMWVTCWSMGGPSSANFFNLFNTNQIEGAVAISPSPWANAYRWTPGRPIQDYSRPMENESTFKTYCRGTMAGKPCESLYQEVIPWFSPLMVGVHGGNDHVKALGYYPDWIRIKDENLHRLLKFKSYNDGRAIYEPKPFIILTGWNDIDHLHRDSITFNYIREMMLSVFRISSEQIVNRTRWYLVGNKPEHTHIWHLLEPFDSASWFERIVRWDLPAGGLGR